jgi:hypothetical protein
MWLIYLIAIVLGGGSLLVQLMAGDHGGADHDPGLDHPGGPGLLSTRSLVYGVFTFGFVGALLHIPGVVEPRTALWIAVGSGIVIGLLVGLVFRTLGDTRASGAAGLEEARGRTGRVLVGCAPGRRGKVRVQLKGHAVDMMATSDAAAIGEGAEVVIVDVRDGVARVEAAQPGKGMS